MVKGAQRRLVVLRTTGSALYEQAYFVLRDDRTEHDDEPSLIAEANRILKENFLPKQQRGKHPRRRAALWLLAGVILGAAAASLLFLIL